LLHSPSQFRSDGPNALGSKAYAADVNETEALGSVSSSVRTAEQTHNAIFWQSAGGPAWLWNGAARSLVDSRGLGLGDSALLLAELNLASADASISVWNDKYHFDFWRPWQAIHGADLDGNPATTPDGTWTALITAPYPEHPSGHVGLDSAALEAMRNFFGTKKLTLEVTSSRFPGETRTFTNVRQPLKEVVEARIWAGLHFRTADMQSKKLGRQVARYMSKHYFQPLH